MNMKTNHSKTQNNIDIITYENNMWLNMWFFVVVKIDLLLQMQRLIDFHRNGNSTEDEHMQ